MTKEERVRFANLRQIVANAVGEALEDDGCCKSYEGTFEVLTCYKDYFNDETGTDGPEYYVIRLHCYVLGPSRHYEWHGKTFGEALRKAEKEIDGWISY